MKREEARQFQKSMLALAVFSALKVHAQAGGQDGSEQAATSGEHIAGIEEIIVTARFQQSLVNRIPIDPWDLPFTLNVLDRNFLDERNFARPIEALTVLPNITRTEDRKGLGTANFLSRGFEAPVLVDNRVQNTFRGSGARDDAFVERYEVLKGPASIANGPIGAGGIINTVTKVPESESFFGVKLRGDQFGSVGGEIDANFGELFGTDVFLLRLNAASRNFEFDADETRRETTAIRPVVTMNLGDATSARASVAYTENTVNPNTGFPLRSDGAVPPEIDTDTFTGFANGEGVAEDVLYEAELNHEFLDNLKLTVRGSRQETDFDYKNTSGLYNYNYADGGPGIGLNDPYVYSYTDRAETESEATFFDAQLAYQAGFWGRPQDFVIGTAYDESSFERHFSVFTTVGPIRLDNLDAPRYGPSEGEIGAVFPHTLSDSELSSVFAEAAIRPTEWLTIMGGVRYDELEQDTTNFRRGNEFVATFDDNETTFRFGATANATDNLNFYASFAQAFAPQFGVQRNSSPVGPEKSDGYEIGAKGALFDHALTFESAYFFTVRSDVAVRDPNSGPGEAFVVTVGELEVQGFELSGGLNPMAGLNFIVNFGLNDIDITEAGQDEVTAAVFPEKTGSAYFSYELQSGFLKGLKLGGGFRYLGERAGPIVDFDSYTVADVNISYPVFDNFDLSLDVLNVNDERYVENSASFAQNLNGGSVLGPPLTASLTLRGRF